MNTLKNKLGKKSGFTLVEMLIVVAIIAILIAISIPLVTSALEAARDRTDQANERSAKAEALIIILTGDTASTEYTTLIAGTPVPYNAKDGKLQVGYTGTYGQCTGMSSCKAGDFLSNSTNHAGKYITVTYTKATDIVTIAWA